MLSSVWPHNDPSSRRISQPPYGLRDALATLPSIALMSPPVPNRPPKLGIEKPNIERPATRALSRSMTTRSRDAIPAAIPLLSLSKQASRATPSPIDRQPSSRSIDLGVPLSGRRRASAVSPTTRLSCMGRRGGADWLAPIGMVVRWGGFSCRMN